MIIMLEASKWATNDVVSPFFKFITGMHDKEKAGVSRDSSAHVLPLEDVNLKDLLHKCWFVERRPVEGVFLWKRNYPFVSHLSLYLRCPTALVRTSERMM